MMRTARDRSALRRPVVLAAAAAIALFAAGMTWLAWRIARPPAPAQGQAAEAGTIGARMQVAAALRTADPSGFARALAPRPFRFPEDHGPHPDFRTEWWYFTGNLAAPDGRRFGFQLTFFRVALAPPGGPPRASAWATRQIYFAHFAVTDAAGRRFQSFERWERQALGLAGAAAQPFHVWVGDWSATGGAPSPNTDTAGGAKARIFAAAASQPEALSLAAGGAPGALPPIHLAAPGALPPIHLVAAAPAAQGGDLTSDGSGGSTPGGPAIDLVLDSALPPVPQGDHGLSAKSAEPGNASYYYSLPRLAATGSVRIAGERIPVRGLAWMDREWSTSALAADEVGWDWFALQLDDGWDLMLYRLRRRPPPAAPPGSGVVDPASRATLIAPDGTTRQLPPSAWSLAETAAWTSPASRIRYPSAWHLRLPAAGPPAVELTVTPLLADQELRLSLRYWEGAVAARGTHDGRPVAGRGYVELTGYGDHD